MSRLSKKSSKISKNSFSLFGIKDRQHLFIQDQVVTNFKPIHKKKGITHTSILPTFNHDRKSFTRAFRLPSEDLQKDEQLIEDHQRKIAESELQISEILCPKPKSKQKNCGVCRKFYDDYKQHTECQQHNNALHNSNYQHLIVEMVDKYRKQSEACELMDEEFRIKNTNEEDIFQCLIMESMDEGSSRCEFKLQSFLWS